MEGRSSLRSYLFSELDEGKGRVNKLCLFCLFPSVIINSNSLLQISGVHTPFFEDSFLVVVIFENYLSIQAFNG